METQKTSNSQSTQRNSQSGTATKDRTRDLTIDADVKDVYTNSEEYGGSEPTITTIYGEGGYWGDNRPVDDCKDAESTLEAVTSRVKKGSQRKSVLSIPGTPVGMLPSDWIGEEAYWYVTVYIREN